MEKAIAIVGAGIQGALLALELAERGASVILIERHEHPMQRASRWNEGKIHLGYVFAHDGIDRTARLMVEGAVSFEPLVGRYVPRTVLTTGGSPPFHYLVMNDSLVAPDELAARYAAIHALAREALARPGSRYLGETGLAEPTPVPPGALAGSIDPDRVSAVFAVAERCVDTEAVARAIGEALASAPRIAVLARTAVERVERTGRGIRLHAADGPIGRFDHVVNATWSDLLRLDATAGVHTARPHLFRRKLAVYARAPERPLATPATTMVLGPYGDVVPYPDGSYYLSWYPLGCIDRTAALAPPEAWDVLPDPPLADEIGRNIVAALTKVLPGLARLVPQFTEAKLGGGTIFSWRDRDIDDPCSELHSRFDVGPHTHGEGYHSVNTGKYTLAPLFARRLADRILPR